ncbi:MAG: glycoside hydrolase family 44 protein [Bryobacteraceae bacterium]
MFAPLSAQPPVAPAEDRPWNGPARRGSVPAAVVPAEDPARQSRSEARVPRPTANSGPAAAMAGPNLAVDAAAGRHVISPYVYGINTYAFDQPSTIGALGVPITRWGGDGTSEYNWQLDKSNAGSDWYFEIFGQSEGVVPPFDPVTFNNSAFDRFHANNQLYGARSIGTIPLLGWVAGPFPDKTCGYSVAKYGAQQKTDPYGPDCGNGKTTTGAAILTNDPRDTDVQVNESFMTQWVQHVVGVFGPASHSGVAVWELDNEPVWWSGVHQSVHPSDSTYDEITSKGLSYAAAVKAGDPTAAVAGPVTAGWWDLFFSKVDLQAGWNSHALPGGKDWMYWNNPIDRAAHGNMDFAAWYLQQFAAYEQQHGRRLLDYFDIHGYLPGANPTDAGGNEDLTANGKAQRLKSTRLFWDPSFIPYNDPLFTASVTNDYLISNQNSAWPQCLCLIPRMKTWVNTYYPGTRLGITEYYLGGQDDMSGVLAQADLLGIFGREGLDYATWWPFHTVSATSPGGFSFRIYRNFDGRGGAFGDIGISALSANQDQLSIYAAQRADHALTLMVINKTATDLSTYIGLSHFAPAGPARVYQYSAANLAAIVPQADLAATPSGLSATFPANSMSLLVIPESGSVLARTPALPRPVRPGASSPAMQ